MVKTAQRPRNITVSMPEEIIYFALTRELYRKYSMKVKEALNILVLEYAYNPDARTLLDQVLENRLDSEQYVSGIGLFPGDEHEKADVKPDIKYVPPQERACIHKQTMLDIPSNKNAAMKALEDRINSIWG